jgi:UPF0176 protein|tara:strand:+ start:2995 stop:3894 length:900 start_codon:yes stop_codon:yes gene_type:complete
MYKIFGFYKFKKIKNIKLLKKNLKNFIEEEQVRGTIIISIEGINGTISFKPTKYKKVKNKILNLLNIRKLDNENISYYKYQAFKKGKIKIKKEVVPIGMKLNKIVTKNKIEPKDWNKFILKKETVLIDTRKNFEFKVGTFKGSINPELNNFRDFPRYFKTLKKNQNIGMFCTGGIRCEKASAYLKKKGFKNVYQLKGGIINYLDNVKKKDSLWSGDCFVFDNRVSIKHGLKPGNLKICPGCRNPIKLSERKSNFYEQGVSCPNCYNNLTNSQKQRFRMRQKQILTAKKHGKKYFFQREA